MRRLVCAILGHRPFIRWFWQGHRRRGVECAIQCRRCGVMMSEPVAPPLQRKLR